MTIKLSTGLRNNMAGSTGFAQTFLRGVIEVRSGAQPATADSPATGTLLGIVTEDGGEFVPGAPANGLTFSAPALGGVSKSAAQWRFTGLAAGTAGWFRLVGNAADAGTLSTTLPRMDGSVANSGGDLNLSSTAIVVGAPTTVDVFAFDIPAQ